MADYRILDCTMRDGGYQNDWLFGRKAKTRVPRYLAAAGVDYIEMGFVQDGEYSRRQSISDDIRRFDEFIPDDSRAKYFVMMTFELDYDLAKLPPKSETKIDGVRLIFKRKNLENFATYARAIKEKGYALSINPQTINSYSGAELDRVVEITNGIKPAIFSIVDTNGSMWPRAVYELAVRFDKGLVPNIALGYHSHDNLKLALPGALRLTELATSRAIVLDSSLRGMGRGAGNLNTELIAEILNNLEGRVDGREKYDMDLIFKAIDEHIGKIARRHAWGYSAIYGMAALADMHPNYAVWLSARKSTNVQAQHALARIPADKRVDFYEDLIADIFADVLDADRK